MELLSKLKFFLHIILSFCSGRENCLCCGRDCFSTVLCRDCIDKYLLAVPNFFEGEYCSLCGKRLLGGQGLCYACSKNPNLHSVDRVYPLYPYRLWYKSLLFEWKMSDQRSLSPIFAMAVIKVLYQIFPCGTRPPIVPVPPRPGKVRERGWDQIEELAAFIKKKSGWPILNALKRLTSDQQKKKGRTERLETSKNSYDIMSCKIPDEVIILDDVMTTGATVEACASLLKGAGAIKVHVITLLIVD